MEYFDIGKIINVHGVKGEIKILPLTDKPERFKKLKSLLICIDNKLVKYNIEKLRYHKKFIIIKLKEINNINEANILRECLIKINRKFAIPLDKDEYYISDIYNMKVFTKNGEYLGMIKEIIKTGSNDVFVINKEKTKDLLIPSIKECILEVDTKNKKMIVKLLGGLR